MRILKPHWCPNCRLYHEEWKVKGSDVRKRIRPGDPWPKLEPIHTEAVYKCDSCGIKMRGSIILQINEHGEPEKLIDVKEVNDG